MGISLRLDDGSVIRASGAGTTVVAADAQESNLSDAHITKLESLLVKMHALVPEAGPLRTVPTEQSPFGTSLKRMFDAEQVSVDIYSSSRDSSTPAAACQPCLIDWPDRWCDLGHNHKTRCAPRGSRTTVVARSSKNTILASVLEQTDTPMVKMVSRGAFFCPRCWCLPDTLVCMVLCRLAQNSAA